MRSQILYRSSRWQQVYAYIFSVVFSGYLFAILHIGTAPAALYIIPVVLHVGIVLYADYRISNVTLYQNGTLTIRRRMIPGFFFFGRTIQVRLGSIERCKINQQFLAARLEWRDRDGVKGSVTVTPKLKIRFSKKPVFYDYGEFIRLMGRRWS